MKLLFSVLTPAYLRSFEGVLTLLAERGHQVHLAIHQPTRTADSTDLAARLAAAHDTITTDEAPPLCDDVHHLALALRACRDYLHFARPQYNARYRARAEARVPPPFRRLADSRLGRLRLVRTALGALVPLAERLLPGSDVARTYLACHAPDVVAFTPYVGLRTVQPDFLRAAQGLGLPTAVCVASWDNLSSKSLLRPVPDVVTVWNESQRVEAERLHGIEAVRVVVTGAQSFDHWFGWPARPREEFCARAGLDPKCPYLLYTCFSPFKGENNETAFVTGWLERLRGHPDPALREIGVLVRPHPKRGTQWRDVDLSVFGNVAVWPREGEMVVDERARADFYDSIFHSVAAVGLNTSAMIEAGIVGRPVHTLLVPEYWESQAGTLHFRYLTEVGGGLLQVAHTWEEHFAQLGASARSAGSPAEPARTFVESFVRPHGLGVAASPILADSLERLADRSAAASPASIRSEHLRRVIVRPVARWAAAARKREAGRRKSRMEVGS